MPTKEVRLELTVVEQVALKGRINLQPEGEVQEVLSEAESEQTINSEEPDPERNML